ncbi:MAG: ATP-binding protein, partial [Desulfobacteraceae bacterium]|nr:ATP-binding protein [Desulfobacteraceae bacterium]
MGKLRIFASGRSQHIRAQARGKLFAEMMTQVLNHDGYHVDHILHSDSAQMEIDVQGKHRKTGFPFYAACRFSETPMPERDLQAFFGRYMIKWHTDRRCHGLFIVLPGLDGAAIKFYREHIKNNTHVTTFLYDEDDALKAISQMPGHVSPDQIADRIPPDIGNPGEGILLYTEKGMFWAYPIISHGGKTPDKIALFDVKGELISDRSIIGYLTKLDPAIANFDNISTGKTGPLQPGLFQDADPIVEVNGSSSCFEYQFPASPRYFVGRKSLFSTLDSFSDQVIHNQTTHRGIVFEGPTGWGKSSMVLASVEHLKKMGHFAVAVDCRTASSSTFIPRVIEYTVGKFGDLDGRIVETDQKKKISGFGSAVRIILDTGQILESQNKLLFIFFDQFENILFLPDVLNQIKDLFLKIVEKHTNIILGFTWDKDLVLSSHAFSNKQLDAVADECRKIILTAFSKAEMGMLLKKLGKELDETLTKGLQSFLEKFSQGYPWLLKILCFHV